MTKRLALTKDGKITYCTASEENIVKGRCNHIAHQKKVKVLKISAEELKI